MRIAFVSANRENMPDAVIPLGVLYVMANTPDGHETTLVDLCFAEDPQRKLAERLRAYNPDLVAIGLRNIQNNDYSDTAHNIAYYAKCIQTVRSVTTAPVVLGGGGFSVVPRGLMEKLHPDFGISGEGEGAFAALVRTLTCGERNFSNIPNLHYFADGKLYSVPASGEFLDLNTLARPDRSLVDVRHYQRYGIDSVQTKRGCSLRCDYCTYPTIEGRSIRQRDPALVVDELFEAKRQHSDLKHVFIVDSVFNLPPKHAKDICREMIRRNYDLPWTCYVNPIGFDQNLAEIMAQAGCAGLEIGSDSGCDEVLTRLKKGRHPAYPTDAKPLPISRPQGLPHVYSGHHG